MKRKLFTFASALSLLLCIATAVLWVRSYFSADAVVFMRRGLLWEVRSERGTLWLDNEPERRASMEPRRVLVEAIKQAQRSPDRRVQPELYELLADHWIRSGQSAVPPSVGHSVRLRAVLLATLPLPVLRVAGATFESRRRRHRPSAGLCRHCGYDLRGTPDHCPECGATATKAAK